jgi:glycosyltransferase 2 family protein
VKLPSRVVRGVQLLLGLGIAAVLVWLAFRHENLASVWRSITGVRVVPLVGAVALATLPFLLRVPRWRLLLGRRDDSTLPTGSLWHAIAIGFTANNVLPARAGELVRVVAINRLARVPLGTGLSSVAVERVLDALVALGLFGIGLVAAHFPSTVSVGGKPAAVVATRLGVICLAALVVAVLAARHRERTVAVLARVLPRRSFSVHIVAFADRVLMGLGAFRDPMHAAPVLAWSLAIWLVNAAAFYVAFFAFGFHLPFSAALVLQGLLLIAIAAPQLPGYVGTFEATIAGALYLYGVDHNSALAYAVVYHITTFIPITTLGAWSAVRTGVGMRPARVAMP